MSTYRYIYVTQEEWEWLRKVLARGGPERLKTLLEEGWAGGLAAEDSES